MDDTDEVQITNSLVQNQPPNPNASSNYGFCAPADTYQVQEFETPITHAERDANRGGFTHPGSGQLRNCRHSAAADCRRTQPDSDAGDQMPDQLLVPWWRMPRHL